MDSLSNYSNEGFLYINTKDKKTFKKGEIVDGLMNVICPGIIVPILPILEKQRDHEDKDILSLENYLDKITHYYPLQKCKKLRIYWDQNHETFMVSTELRVYPCYEEEIDLSSVHVDLLDKNCCYYVDMLYNNNNIIEKNKETLILTNIVDKTKPDLQSSYNIQHDLAFKNHVELCNFTHSIIEEAFENGIFENGIFENGIFENGIFENGIFENGILCILQDGQQVELRTPNYNYYCSLSKPDNMCIVDYYILCLNKDAEGESIWDYFISLHDYISEFLDAYPEYIEACESMSKKLLNYIDKYELFDNIDAITNVITMKSESLLQLICNA